MRGKIVATPAGFYIDLCWQGGRYKIRDRGKAFKSKRWAFRTLEHIRDEIDDERRGKGDFDVTYWAPAQRKKHLVKNLVEKWINSQQFRPATLRQKQEIINKHIIPLWGNRDIRKLRRHHYMDMSVSYTHLTLPTILLV